MTLPSFHFTTFMYHSHPRHILLPYTSLHITSLHFTYHIPSPFPKITWSDNTANTITNMPHPPNAGQYLCCHRLSSNRSCICIYIKLAPRTITRMKRQRTHFQVLIFRFLEIGQEDKMLQIVSTGEKKRLFVY
jgi:hypothetical protein